MVYRKWLIYNDPFSFSLDAMSPLIDNQEQRILVTGAFHGVGWSVVSYLLQKGYSVLAVDRTPPTGTQSDFLDVHASRVRIAMIDFLQEPAYREVEQFVSDDRELLTGLFAYAGLTSVASIEECSQRIFDDIMSVNLRSSFFMTQIFLRHRSKKSGGSIVYCGSPHQYRGDRDRAAYAVSKGALMTLNNHVALHYSDQKVRSNIIVPGWTRTEGELELRRQMGVDSRGLEGIVHTAVPIKRLIEPCEYDELVEFLLSARSSLITGSIIDSTGGLYV